MLGAIVDLAALVLVVALFRIHWILGFLSIIAFLMFMPGTFFREMDDKRKRMPGHRAKASPLAHLVGLQGEVVATLKPQGMIQVGDERINARSETELIEVGTVVSIIGAELTTVVVEPQTRT